MKKPFGVVYKITNLDNGKAYVGQTTQSVRQRFVQHCSAHSVLGAAIRKHGLFNFTYEPLATTFDRDSMDRIEVDLIREMKTHVSQNGYNVRREIGVVSSTRPREQSNTSKLIRPAECFRTEVSKYNLKICSELTRSLRDKGLDLVSEFNDLANNQSKISEQKQKALLSLLPYAFALRMNRV